VRTVHVEHGARKDEDVNGTTDNARRPPPPQPGSLPRDFNLFDEHCYVERFSSLLEALDAVAGMVKGPKNRRFTIVGTTTNRHEPTAPRMTVMFRPHRRRVQSNGRLHIECDSFDLLRMVRDFGDQPQFSEPEQRSVWDRLLNPEV
jgi:hypothetical protein